jgi:uncharacterized protein YjbI with pentapeptide repeats
MSEVLKVSHKDIAGSVFQGANMRGAEFRDVNLAKAVFDGVDLSGARFFNVNLREAQIGAVDFGGASFSCMNTGEGHPRVPAEIQNIELDDCTVRTCYFRNTKFVDCDWSGATIDGVPVTELIAAYRQLYAK